tara:strand:+ start:1033 stop:2394 length:1362 start_codon:yes stop_codon:yes gene_type:complete
MAYTIEQSMTGVRGVADEIAFVAKDTSYTSEAKYRYACKVTINAQEIGTFKQLPNNADCTVFRLNDILSAYVKQEQNAWRLGAYDTSDTSNTTQIFSTNAYALEGVTLNFGYEYATTPEDSPTLYLNQYIITNLYAVNGSFQSVTEATNLPTKVENFQMDTPLKQFLSDVVIDDYLVYNQWVDANQYGALAFLNGDNVGSTKSGFLRVAFFNGGTTLNEGYFTNNSSGGGEAPTTGLTNGQSLLYVGCFPQNLESQTIVAGLKPSDVGNANWTHYDIAMWDSATSGLRASATYRFHNLGCSNQEKTYVLAWWNSVGGIDQLVFDASHRESQSMERSKFRQRGGNAFDANGGTVPYTTNPYDGGLTSAGVQTTTSLELNTRNLKPETVTPLIRSLMNSDRVYAYGSGFGSSIVGENAYVRVFVTSGQMEYKTARNDRSVSYKVNVEVSRKRQNV